MVFFEWCKLQRFFNVEFIVLQIGADEIVCLFWFKGNVDASCFDHDDARSMFFEVDGDVATEDVCLVSLGNILVDEVDRWHDALVSFWVVGVC